MRRTSDARVSVSLAIGDCRAVADRLTVRSALLDRLLVRLDVEVDEQPEVAREQNTSKDSGRLGSSA